MIRLVVIADDFTGSLDTGIKFAQTGAVTQMMIGADFELARIKETCQVLIVDSETRHLPSKEAYGIVYDLVKRLAQYGVQTFYKKTDSALRGCVGAELAALSDALGHRVHFVPALPKENRVTIGGVQYIDGVPVSKSIFGEDPFEPVTKDSVSEIIGQQNDISVVGVRKGFGVPISGKRTVVVYDAETNGDILEVAEHLKAQNELKAVAGCAGFANVLNQVMELQGSEKGGIEKKKNIFVACGTVNKITGEQLAYAEKNGFDRISMTIEQKLGKDYLHTADGKLFLEKLKMYSCKERPLIVDVFANDDVVKEAIDYCHSHDLNEEDARVMIADRLGEVLECWVDFGIDSIMILSGGDTVYGFLKRMKCDEVCPVCEVLQGAVLFKAIVKETGRVLHIVSKSGGFGTEDFFKRAFEMLVY